MATTKQVVITRKIELYLDGYEGEAFKEAFHTLYRWRKICFKSANLIASHHFNQEQVKELFYFTDETKVKLSNVEKDENGILSTSKQNTTYRVLSKMFKGEIPMAIISALNSIVVSSFNKEKKNYFLGERSLRNYKSTIPIPFQAKDLIGMKKSENEKNKKGYNYTFTLYGLNFRTNFGADLSGNRIIWGRSLEGEYKLCNSSIQIYKDKGKPTRIFLLAVFRFDKLNVNIDKNKSCHVRLDFNIPLILNIAGTDIKIGNKEEFLYRRLAIQAGLRRAQIASRFNKGGKGIQKKIAAIERYKESETSYVTSRVHKYSANLIDLCIKYKIGNIVLENITEVKDKTKENDYLLRNWSYFGLREKIVYKAGKYGIEIIEPEKKKLKEEEIN